MTSPDLIALADGYAAAGYVVLSQMLAPREVGELEAELDRELTAAYGDALKTTPEVRPIDGFYLPLLRSAAPVTCRLVEDPRLVTVAEALLSDRVFVDPVSPGAVSFYGAAPWHRDADLDVPGIKFVTYLETLRQGAGAIHLCPGSQLARPLPGGGYEGLDLAASQQMVVELDPGDVLALDLRIWHANPAPIRRRQWTVSYLRRPAKKDEHAALLGWLEEGATYDTIEPLPNGLRWLDPDWVDDSAPSDIKAFWLEELASFGRIPARSSPAL